MVGWMSGISHVISNYSKQQLFILFTFRNINKHVDIHASTNMLILSPVFVSLLQSQIIAFAVQCRSFTPSLWTERSLNKSQNRQFTIITMYQVTFNPNSSRRTSLHWGRWLTGINTPLFTSYIRCFPPQWKCNFPRKTAGINNHIAMLKYDKCHRYGS